MQGQRARSESETGGEMAVKGNGRWQWQWRMGWQRAVMATGGDEGSVSGVAVVAAKIKREETKEG